ncbi:MAG: DUF4314 domain-containing protein [Candidatus Heimdallarchaeota archaeon]
MIYIKEYNIFNNLAFKPAMEDIKNGDYIVMKAMREEKDPIQPETRGIIQQVHINIKTIEVKWENGRTLSVLYDIDDFEIISR